MNFVTFLLAFANFAEVKIYKQCQSNGTYFLCTWENEEDRSPIKTLTKEFQQWLNLRSENSGIVRLHKQWLTFGRDEDLCIFNTVEVKAEDCYFVEEL